jgi:hypothetical protein
MISGFSVCQLLISRVTGHVVAFAQGAGAVAATAAIHGAKKIIAKKKPDAEKPKIVLTDK